MNPRYPVFIPTKGRYKQRYTIKMFQKLGVPFTIFVEAQEYDLYREHVDEKQIHVLPHANKGLTVTRNYIWDYAESLGVDWFWTFDDNIRGLYRFNHNLKTPVSDGTIMAVVEDFANRYSNTAIVGMNYFMFVSRKALQPPYTLNTRIYSNMLIRLGARDRQGNKFRNVTFFNDDTDLCLRVLKDGWCTVLFNAFLIDKQTTMESDGGMSEYYAKTEKRKEFVQELIDAHPDIVNLTEKWGRWHHNVDYSKFKQQLKRVEGLVVPDVVNNFGMALEEKIDGRWIRQEETPKEPVEV